MMNGSILILLVIGIVLTLSGLLALRNKYNCAPMLLICSVICLLSASIFYSKSKFGDGMTGSFNYYSNEPEPVLSRIDSGNPMYPSNIRPDTVVIIFAPWCGYCKRSMSDFEESVELGNGKVVMVNSEEEKELAEQLMKEAGSTSFPTIAKGFGTGKPIGYEGSRIADAILAFQSY
jgi:thiol-disulfide isomerase/thioredoxin